MTDSSPLLSSGSTAGKTPPGSGENNGSGGSGQHVVREIGVGPANWPLLTKTNYT
jgi:transposase InsO family protein